jgi:hypothetical protein
VLVVKEQNNWLAIVGVPLTVKPGSQQISSGGRNLPFTVGNKKYPEQRITLKNTAGQPDPANLKRIDRELAEQIKAYRSFSPNTPSNLLLDKPVNGPLSSKFGVRRFFNGEERNPTPAWTSRCRPARRSRPRRQWQGDPGRQLLLQRQHGVCRPWPGLHQHVLPHVENRCEGRPATGPW